jgi:small subunit ribosomal protein S16
MVKMRLSRQGRKHLPSYKIVIVNAREKRESMFVDYIGSYSPMTKELIVDKNKAQEWLKKGVQPTDTVRRLLIKDGVLEKPVITKPFAAKPGKKKQERAVK